MAGDLIKSKLKAAGIHLGISNFIFFGILYLIRVEWYPGEWYLLKPKNAHYLSKGDLG